MALELTVLGSSGGYAGPGKACAGHLLRYDGHSLVLDLGSGALSNLLKYVGADRLEGLAISHMHYDHYVDIYGLCTARRFWESHLPPLPVLAPGDAQSVLGSPLAERTVEMFLECIDFVPLDNGEPVDFAGFKVKALPADHGGMEAYVLRVGAGGRAVCYTGDTDLTDSVVELAREADLLISEATFTSEVPRKLPGHLSAFEAGEMAAEAGVRRLLLTHVWPTLDAKRAVEDARAVFDGPVDLAVEGLTLEI